MTLWNCWIVVRLFLIPMIGGISYKRRQWLIWGYGDTRLPSLRTRGPKCHTSRPKCHTSRAKMSHKGQNVTQSCYNSIPGRSRGHAQGVRTWDLPGTGGRRYGPPPQLMSEPFPRDKVEMTRNMSCGEATSLQHNKNTWLNPNYNPAKTRQAKTKQHSSNRPKRQMSVSVLTVNFDYGIVSWTHLGLWSQLLQRPSR